MEHHWPQKGTQQNQAHTNGFMAIDCGDGSPISEDLTFSGILNFDGLIEPQSPLAADLFFSSFNFSSLNPTFGNCVSLTFPGGLEQAPDSIQGNGGTFDCGYSRFSENLEATKLNFQFEGSPSSTREDKIGFDTSDSQIDSAQNAAKGTPSVVPKSVGGFTFSDRMLRALSLLKGSSGGGILAQVWIPIKQGDKYMLSTSEQPFLLDQALAGYREISRVFTFSAKETPGMYPGVPGRVFISGMPEWTSNVIYYYKYEYLRVDYAVSHEVRGSLAVPIFDLNKSTCCAVLEIVTTKEKSNFNIELENVCQALQAVDLRMTNAHAHHQHLTKDQKSALSEILNVLRAVCHAHVLPLALTWMPVARDSEIVDDDGNAAKCNIERCLKETVLCIQESASYVNDSQMCGFLQACTEHYLAKGQGIAGKAFLSNHPFFSPDVKGYDIGEYPLAHHARKFGLQAAVAIRLRSTYTGDDDFILELFLPVNCKGSAEQQLLLNNLSVTMQRICRSLRTVLDIEVTSHEVSEVDAKNMEEANFHSSEITARNSQPMFNRNLLMSNRNKEVAEAPSNGQNVESDEQVNCGSQKQRDKKRITSLKHISLNVLQKYFAGSLKDAAKSLGVCPTTLKRICRLHGILRWPSRKIKKVNHSLKKIQSVISSVQGAEGTFKYDMKTGCLVAAVIPENLAVVTLESLNNDMPLSSAPWFEDWKSDEKLELNNNKLTDQRLKATNSLNLPNTDTDEVHLPNGCSTKSKISSNIGSSRHADIKGSGKWPLRDSCFEDCTDKIGLQIPNSQAMLRSSDSAVEEDATHFKVGLNVFKEHSHPSVSSMTDSSSESSSSCQIFKESSKDELFVTNKGSAYKVKATYKDDIVRFKLLPSMGCLHLYDEVGKRFKLCSGTFQLKYMDDEEEWVMLTSDSDLQECIEVLQSIASRCIKLQVRDVPLTAISPVSSSCLLMDR